MDKGKRKANICSHVLIISEGERGRKGDTLLPGDPQSERDAARPGGSMFSQEPPVRFSLLLTLMGDCVDQAAFGKHCFVGLKSLLVIDYYCGSKEEPYN